MGKVVTDGNISIGYEYFKGVRKKPCVMVRIGNDGYILGTFANEVNAEFFVDKLAEMTRAKDEREVIGNDGAAEKDT
jgi:hypothetical protein